MIGYADTHPLVAVTVTTSIHDPNSCLPGSATNAGVAIGSG